MADTREQECADLRENLIAALMSLRDGEFSARLKLKSSNAQDRQIADLFNEVVSLNENITGEFGRMARIVGKEGKIAHRASVKGANGGWQTKLDGCRSSDPATFG